MKDYNFFNIYAKTREKGQKRAVLMIGLAAAMAFVAFCLFTVHYTFELRLRALRFRIEANNVFLTDPSVLDKRRRNRELTEALMDLELYNKKTQELSEKLLSSSLVKTTLLQSISEVMPTDVYIKTLTISQGSANIGGASSNKYAIAEFERNIKSLPFTENVFVAGIITDEIESSFTISFNIKDVAN